MLFWSETITFGTTNIRFYRYIKIQVMRSSHENWRTLSYTQKFLFSAIIVFTPHLRNWKSLETPRDKNEMIKWMNIYAEKTLGNGCKTVLWVVLLVIAHDWIKPNITISYNVIKSGDLLLSSSGPDINVFALLCIIDYLVIGAVKIRFNEFDYNI